MNKSDGLSQRPDHKKGVELDNSGKVLLELKIFTKTTQPSTWTSLQKQQTSNPPILVQRIGSNPSILIRSSILGQQEEQWNRENLLSICLSFLLLFYLYKLLLIVLLTNPSQHCLLICSSLLSRLLVCSSPAYLLSTLYVTPYFMCPYQNLHVVLNMCLQSMCLTRVGYMNIYYMGFGLGLGQ